MRLINTSLLPDFNLDLHYLVLFPKLLKDSALDELLLTVASKMTERAKRTVAKLMTILASP